ncbi:pyridoxamine 5'-phosphate oxidase family protein [Candidatus Borrarchaeum sp.]|uniref:pyridoxamine 5'-phosphate oxidase family protein n=1 Tax=Candidatus Borrarchaeum sp. TaxID=2846742 RepID=UPI00257AB3DF|nr:pyridoxamine 5'-phosphate oxidase family protein [Candidatus Borrarchaeum sp.]
MRRKDKEIKDKNEIEAILKRAVVCRIALSENNKPYIVPVNFFYTNNYVYFHSAPEGKKLDIIRNNNSVCFEIDTDYDIIKSKTPCNWSAKYRSVIGFGKAYFVEDFEEKKSALNWLVQKYSDTSVEYEFSEGIVDTITIVRIKIESMTGKKSGY